MFRQNFDISGSCRQVGQIIRDCDVAVSPHTDLLILNDEPNFDVPNCFQLIYVDKFDKSPVFFLPAHTPHSSTFQVNPPMGMVHPRGFGHLKSVSFHGFIFIKRFLLS